MDQLPRLGSKSAPIAVKRRVQRHGVMLPSAALDRVNTEGCVMILGMTTFTFAHVALSLMGILAGFVVLVGLLRGDRMDGWTHIFLATTVATTLTGFLFPSNGFTPAIGVGIVSTLVLLATLAGRYRYRLAGPWRLVYVVGAMAALYLNTFVLVVQAFLKVPAFHALAPGGNEPPFAIAQGIVLVFFVVTGYLSVKRFHPAAA